MEDVVADATAQPRFMLVLLAAFSVVATMLAAVGIYGVVGYAVAQRTREIGVRVAVGAVPRDVLRLVLGEGLRIACIGIVIGAAGALLLMRLMRGVLYGVTPSDPATFVAAAAALGLVALLASWLPAKRALRIDPVTALRGE